MRRVGEPRASAVGCAHDVLIAGRRSRAPRMIRTAVWRSAAVAAGLLAAAAAPAAANVPLTRVSADPFTNPTSQHATEVEPDTYAFGSTVVAAFQVGRFFNGGATDVGFVRST